MKVCKFGGSSLADANQIRKVCEIILADPQRRAVVVSAPGKRYNRDTKVTDLLIALANAIISGYDGSRELDAVVSRFSLIIDDLHLDEGLTETIANDIQNRVNSYDGNRNLFLDTMKAAGEDNCAKLVAAYLNEIGEDAIYVNLLETGFYLTNDYGHVKVLPETYDNIYRLNKHNEVLIFPGFFGFNKKGEILTFSRGGSDITGSIIAAALRASIYENWTDVDNVYSVNPNLVKDPHPIKEITYDEMRELAYAGFTVLHEEALEPAVRRNIPVNIRNTNNPEADGTQIVSKRTNYDGILTGIAGKKGFVVLHLSKYLMNGEVGFALKVLQILADLHIPFDHMPSGIDSLSIVMREEDFNSDKEKIVIDRLKNELKVDEVHVQRNVSIVMIVGAAMSQTVGVTSRACGALSHSGINIEFIVQGASEISIMFGIKEAFCNYAVQALYHEFYPF
ncbi:MAG: aspartate kinase [Fastidiosipilaceae bacterium]|jgi:aspartate kinase|nr:aspartate kinase [Clostridiaceae bacterium]